MLSEAGQAEKDKCCVISLIRGILKTKTDQPTTTKTPELMDIETRLAAVSGSGWAKWVRGVRKQSTGERAEVGSHSAYLLQIEIALHSLTFHCF